MRPDHVLTTFFTNCSSVYRIVTKKVTQRYIIMTGTILENGDHDRDNHKTNLAGLDNILLSSLSEDSILY